MWCGFIKPELYTQDYSGTIFELEIECISAMSVLEYIDYKTKNEAEKGFVTLWELLTRCVSESRGSYSNVYIPHVYAKDKSNYTAWANVLQDMTISEQNFFDEEDKPMKLKEVLEEICKFLNWTCVDWKGDLYFVDVDHAGDYYKYTLDFSTYTTVRGFTISVQKVTFSGDNHTLDILGGYNKVTVKDSNYPVGNLLPDEDFKKDKKLLSRLNSRLDRRCYRKYLYPKNWDMFLYNEGKIITNKDLELYAYGAHEFEGGILERYCDYKIEDGKPDISDYSFTDVIQIKWPKERYGNDAPNEGGGKVMTIKGAAAVYSTGIFCVSGSYKFINVDDMIPWDNSSTPTHLYAQIRIGSMYYGSLRPGAGQPNEWAANPGYTFKLDYDRTGAKQDYYPMINQKL